MRSMRNTGLQLVLFILLLFVSLVYFVPVLLILLNSLKSEAESNVLNFTLPAHFLWSNYGEVLNSGNIIRPFLNGIIVSFWVVLLTLITSSTAAFVIQRRMNKSNHAIRMYFIAGLIAPFSVVPAIKLLQLLHLSGTFTGLILIDTATAIPFSFLLYLGFIQGIPRELDEAGVIDGCKPIRLFFQIIFPLLKPIIATNVVLVFTSVWNEFQNVLYFLSKSSMWTMPMTVYNFQSLHTYNYSLVCADILFVLSPVILLYVFAQNYIVSGMTSGAVKS